MDRTPSLSFWVDGVDRVLGGLAVAYSATIRRNRVDMVCFTGLGATGD